MFREMRRSNQQLEREECLRILREGENGVLALLGDGGYPYAVPLNYVFDDGAIYFTAPPRATRSTPSASAIRRPSA